MTREQEVKALLERARQWLAKAPRQQQQPCYEGDQLISDLVSALDQDVQTVRDAARYRWLRNNMTYKDRGPNGNTGLLCTPLTRRWYHDSTELTCDTIDAAIDAMLSASQESNDGR